MLAGLAAGCAAPLERTIHVSFTMDCERIRAHCPLGGPSDWELSERAIRGYCERLLEAGYPPTLFVVPDTAIAHAALFRELAARGVEIGMHFHPQCYADGTLDKFLAMYPEAEQRAMIEEGRAVITAAVGIEPLAFRPGNFSADEATYRALVDLGFSHGSVSDPGRVSPKYAALWRGASPDVHYASGTDRLGPGHLPFVEFPMTTDPNPRRNRGSFPRELRIENGTFTALHGPVLAAHLNRMAADSVTFRAVSLFTHNYWDYSDPDSKHRRRLEDLITALDALRDTGWNVHGGTLADLATRYRIATGAPIAAPATAP